METLERGQGEVRSFPMPQSPIPQPPLVLSDMTEEETG